MDAKQTNKKKTKTKKEKLQSLDQEWKQNQGSEQIQEYMEKEEVCVKAILGYEIDSTDHFQLMDHLCVIWN